VLSNNPKLAAAFPEALERAGHVRPLPGNFWSDDRSNLFDILK
jgi:hypothetical protein